MRRRYLALAAAPILVAVACTASEETASAPAPVDAAAPLAEASADAPDAQEPDAADAADASIPCSSEGYCYLPLPKKLSAVSVWGDAAGEVWVAAGSGEIFRREAGAWSLSATFARPDTTDVLSTIWGASAVDLWAVGNGGVYHGTGPSPKALLWSEVTRASASGVWGRAANDVWIPRQTTPGFGAPWVLAHYRGPSGDGGGGWDPDLTPPAGAYRAVWGTATDTFFGGRKDNPDFSTALSILKKTPTGLAAVGAPSVPINPVTGAPGLDTVLAGVVLASSDTLLRVTPTPAGNCYNLSRHGAAAPAATWTTVDVAPSELSCLSLRALWAFGKDDFWIGADAGLLRHWNGTTFAIARYLTPEVVLPPVINSIWGLSSNDLWVVGDNGLVLHRKVSQ